MGFKTKYTRVEGCFAVRQRWIKAIVGELIPFEAVIRMCPIGFRYLARTRHPSEVVVGSSWG